eukprot:831337-Rhodomonas_salina.5
MSAGGRWVPVIALPASYAMSGTRIVYGVRASYAMSGTGVVYGVRASYAMSGTGIVYGIMPPYGLCWQSVWRADRGTKNSNCGSTVSDSGANISGCGGCQCREDDGHTHVNAHEQYQPLPPRTLDAGTKIGRTTVCCLVLLASLLVLKAYLGVRDLKPGYDATRRNVVFLVCKTHPW